MCMAVSIQIQHTTLSIASQIWWNSPTPSEMCVCGCGGGGESNFLKKAHQEIFRARGRRSLRSRGLRQSLHCLRCIRVSFESITITSWPLCVPISFAASNDLPSMNIAGAESATSLATMFGVSASMTLVRNVSTIYHSAPVYLKCFRLLVCCCAIEMWCSRETSCYLCFQGQVAIRKVSLIFCCKPFINLLKHYQTYELVNDHSLTCAS